jgi:hypothetical protein
MPLLAVAAPIVIGLRFSLDDYTNWYNSPAAAVLFWSVFVAVIVVITLVTLWVFRRRAR